MHEVDTSRWKSSSHTIFNWSWAEDPMTSYYKRNSISTKYHLRGLSKQLQYSMAFNLHITFSYDFCTFNVGENRLMHSCTFYTDIYLCYLWQPVNSKQITSVVNIRYKPLQLADCSVVLKPPVALKQSWVSWVHFLNLSKQISTTRWLVICNMQAICVYQSINQSIIYF